MTNPAPSYEQVWNWKKNVKGGCSLYQEKQKPPKASSEGITEPTQMNNSNWKRGPMEWRLLSCAGRKNKTWKHNANIMCDPDTGNTGWDMTDTDNKEKTEAEPHKRDKDTHSNPDKNKKKTS